MSEYKAPVTDIAFVLEEHVGMAEIAALPGLEEATPDLVRAILEGAAQHPSLLRFLGPLPRGSILVCDAPYLHGTLFESTSQAEVFLVDRLKYLLNAYCHRLIVW